MDLDPELVEWFASGVDEGDAPELHIVGLGPGELVRCFALIEATDPQWNDRTFYLDADDIDVTMAQRADVAELVVAGRVSYPCIGAECMTVAGQVLPLVEMFLLADEIEFFWWPSAEWTHDRVAAFLSLVQLLLDATAGARLAVDPRYTEEAQRRYSQLIAQALANP